MTPRDQDSFFNPLRFERRCDQNHEKPRPHQKQSGSDINPHSAPFHLGPCPVSSTKRPSFPVSKSSISQKLLPKSSVFKPIPLPLHIDPANLVKIKLLNPTGVYSHAFIALDYDSHTLVILKEALKNGRQEMANGSVILSCF